jgi:hypothetical protein
MNPRHQLTQHRHCSRFIVQRFLFTLLVTSSFPSLSPLYRSSPQDAPHRWNHRPSPRNLHPHQMDLDRPLYFTASQTTDAAGRRGDSRPSKYHHGVSFHCFCLEEDTQKTAALGKTFRTQTFCGVRSPPPLLPISRILTLPRIVITQIMDNRPRSTTPYPPSHRNMGETTHAA